MDEATQKQILRFVAGTSAMFSIIGSVSIIIFSLLRIQKMANSCANRLIFFLSVADLCASLAYVIRMLGVDQSRHEICVLEGFIMTTFELASVMWSGCIAFHLLITVLLHQYIKKHACFRNCIELGYHVVSWIYPVSWSLLLFYNHRFGQVFQWCWVVDDEVPFSWRFFTFVPVYIVMTFNSAAYICVLCALRRMLKWSRERREHYSDSLKAKELKVNLRLLMFIVAFFLTWFAPFLNRFVESVTTDQHFFILELAQAITNPLGGFFNVWLYGCTQQHLRIPSSLQKKRQKLLDSLSSPFRAILFLFIPCLFPVDDIDGTLSEEYDTIDNVNSDSSDDVFLTYREIKPPEENDTFQYYQQMEKESARGNSHASTASETNSFLNDNFQSDRSESTGLPVSNYDFDD